MTNNAKKTGLTLAGIVAAVILVAGVFPHIKPWLDWLAPIAGRESVQHVALGWLAAAFTLPLPWVLPERLAPIWTRQIAALVAFIVAVVTVFALSWPPTRTNAIYALFMAGLGSVTINAAITGLYLHLRPQSRPESLKP